MEPSKVYFTDMRAHPGSNLLDKLQKLMRAAGFEALDLHKKFVAIKIHFGEPGNLAYLRPNFARAVADLVKEQGGYPFLTDCNTLYAGRRKNALEHITSAYENGFSPFSTGCHVIIADGLKGLDEVAVPVENGELVTEAKIGRAIMDADVILSLSHFKGHENAGFGGALKNLGMGGGSRAGKMEQHCSGKPEVNPKRCVGCRQCAKFCAQNAIAYGEGKGGKAHIDHALCVGCGRCIAACNFDAIRNRNASANSELNKKIAEYTKAVVTGRPQFHISIVMDVSPFCDCHGDNDVPIIQDVGMFASVDAVALDMACVDACNRQPALPGSLLAEQLEHGCDHHDHFRSISPDTDWRTCLAHAEKIGVGTMSYELITVK